jgi:hypothetical protein
MGVPAEPSPPESKELDVPPLPISKKTRVWLEVTRTCGQLVAVILQAIILLKLFNKI